MSETLGEGHDREGEHHAIGVLLADLGDEERAHAGASTTTERVADLESLEAVARLGLLRTTSRTESISSAPSV